MKFHFLRMAAIAATALAVVACNKKGLEPEPAPEPTPVDPYANVKPYLPRHEMRGVWIATVYGNDWPQDKYEANAQRQLYISLLDCYKNLNINTIFFQVRPMADAFYDSPYEPWSKYITGTAGKAPSFDLLPWLIEEAHNRGMEFHAWMNPYRVATRSKATASFPTLDSKIPANLLKDYNKIRVYNPALPEVRNRLAAIVKDLIEKFDIDGIHFDDYFYPSLESGESMNDSSEYSKYGSGYSDIKDWRRGNVEKMVQAIHDVILDTRPDITFTISPQGNYDNNYNTQYIDIPTICSKNLIDIVIPQLYWATRSETKDYYTPRLEWFSTHISNTKMMVGYAAYRFDGTDSNLKAGFKSKEELDTQLNLADGKSNCVGGVFYNARSIYDNLMDINSVLSTHYSSKALIPCVRNNAPSMKRAPENVAVEGKNLVWTEVDDAEYYAVYRSNGDKKVATLIGTTTDTKYALNSKGKGYFVTALNKYNNESPVSKVVAYQ